MTDGHLVTDTEGIPVIPLESPGIRPAQVITEVPYRDHRTTKRITVAKATQEFEVIGLPTGSEHLVLCKYSKQNFPTFLYVRTYGTLSIDFPCQKFQ